MTYHQITFEERYTLGLLRQRGLSPAAIARLLGHHRSTIGREVRRNRARSESTSPHPITRGNEAPTKTPTAWYANICPSAKAWPTSPNTTAMASLRN